MQLDHAFGSKARGLMQVIDVLRDQRGDLAGAMQGGQSLMSTARTCGCKTRFHGEPPAPSLVTHILTGDKLVVRDRAVFGPKPARRPKVRDPALGGDPRAGKRDNDGRLIDQSSQTIDGGLEIGRDHLCWAQGLRRKRSDNAISAHTGVKIHEQAKHDNEARRPVLACAIPVRPHGATLFTIHHVGRIP